MATICVCQSRHDALTKSGELMMMVILGGAARCRAAARRGGDGAAGNRAGGRPRTAALSRLYSARDRDADARWPGSAIQPIAGGVMDRRRSSGPFQTFRRSHCNRQCQSFRGSRFMHAPIGPNGAGKTTLINQAATCPDIRSGLWHRDRRPPAWQRVRTDWRGPSRSRTADHNALDNVALAVQVRQGHSFRFFAERKSGRL